MSVDASRADAVRDISAIIEAALSRNIRVLLCGMESPPTRGLDYSVAFHSLFPALAQRHSIPLVASGQ